MIFLRLFLYVIYGIWMNISTSLMTRMKVSGKRWNCWSNRTLRGCCWKSDSQDFILTAGAHSCTPAVVWKTSVVSSFRCGIIFQPSLYLSPEQHLIQPSVHIHVHESTSYSDSGSCHYITGIVHPLVHPGKPYSASPYGWRGDNIPLRISDGEWGG